MLKTGEKEVKGGKTDGLTIRPIFEVLLKAGIS
jgi:hypothetical protein